MRALRAGLSLRVLAEAIGSSRSELSRIERGEKTASRELAARLDEHFDLDGALATALLGRDPSVGGDTRRVDRQHWLHHFPALYSGPVWILLSPNADGQDVRLRIDWGPWRYQRTLSIAAPLALHCGKGDDGLSVPVRLRMEPPGDVRFGVGVPPTDAATADINAGWVYRQA